MGEDKQTNILSKKLQIFFSHEFQHVLVLKRTVIETVLLSTYIMFWLKNKKIYFW